MTGQLREIGQANGAPILLIHAHVGERDWLGLAYRPRMSDMCMCFWSTRDEIRVSAEELAVQICTAVAEALAGTEAQVLDRLWDVSYLQPVGWDRWGRPGVPNPIRAYFDEDLYPKLLALLVR